MTNFLLPLLGITFIMILPGVLFTAALFQKSDYIEKSVLTVLLSMFSNYTGIFIMEKIAGRLTPLNSALAVILVNLIALIILFAKKYKKRQL